MCNPPKCEAPLLLRVVSLLPLCGTGLFLLLAVTSPLCAQGVDNQLWFDETFSVTLSPRTALRLHFNQRLRDSASDLFEATFQAGVAFKLRPWLTLYPAFQHTRHDPSHPTSRFENRPMLNFELQTQRGRWQPSARGRFEGRFFEHQPAFLRVRLRPGLQYNLPVGWPRHGRGWQRPPGLVVNNEFFFDTRADRYNRNKVLVGVSLPVTAHLSLLPYYMLLSNRPAAAWTHANVWGLSLSWRY